MKFKITNSLFLNSLLVVLLFFTCSGLTAQTKPTILILGGTPSTSSIVNEIPDSLKLKYNFISFNRPGFGGTKNARLTDKMLFDLAKKAGLRENDFGVIGISGGAPLALLIASEFKLKHCGVISGMVSKKAFFEYADSAVTKDLMNNVLAGYDQFKKAFYQFPNIDQIVKMAGSTSNEAAIRASYDDLYFILNTDVTTAIREKSLEIDWYHGEKDVNVPLKSAQLFLEDFPNSNLSIIPGANHGIDGRIYIQKLLTTWATSDSK